MKYLDDPDLTLHHGDALEVLRTLPDESVHVCVTSPPFFGLRDYGTGAWEGGDEGCDHVKTPRAKAPERYSPGGDFIKGGSAILYEEVCGKCGATRVDNQIGLEDSPEAWASRLVEVFREVRRVLRADGTCWVECGDSYASSTAGDKRTTETVSAAVKGYDDNFSRKVQHQSGMHHKRDTGLKPKDLLLQPYLLASALRADGWYLRGMYVWARPNPMPESVTDRCTTSHSFVIHLAKRSKYFFDAEAIREQHEGYVYSGRAGIAADGYEGAVDGGLGKPRKTFVQHRDYNPAGRNARSVWTIPTEANGLALCRVCNAYWEGGAPAKHCGEPVVGHYAAFPQKLVERCIKAGTSERGCCPECGAPWVRQVEMTDEYRAVLADDGAWKSEEGKPDEMTKRQRKDHPANVPTKYRTLGWKPSCDCTGRDDVFHPPVPCTVLDPFSGSGTMLLVARRLGRHAIGIELNPHYAEMTSRRLAQLSLLGSA